MTKRDRWKNRRLMAWTSLVAALLFPLLLLFTESPQLGSIATPFYVFVSAVVGAYIGFATIDDNNFKDVDRSDYGEICDNCGAQRR